MRPPPRLRLEPRPSRLLGRALAGAACATAGLVALLPLPPLVRLALILVVVLVTLRAARATLGSGLPAIVHVGADRRLTVTARDGRCCAGSIATESRVGPRLTTIVWHDDAPSHRWARRPATLLILPDMLAPEDFRQLRVLLRYGRALDPAAVATSGRSAGRPASQAPPSKTRPLSPLACAPSNHR
jgi:hypothetical protein